VAVLTAALGPFGLGARVGAAAALATLVAFPLGACFPLGLRRFGGTSAPWLWAVNGCAGVLASVSSLALAMEIGFSGVTAAAALCYAVASAAALGRAPRLAANGTTAP
jgi:hypothetical protein